MKDLLEMRVHLKRQTAVSDGGDDQVDRLAKQ